jgi:hypothetical protein
MTESCLCHASVLPWPSLCQAIAMFQLCLCHANVLPRSCLCQAKAMSVSCLCHARVYTDIKENQIFLIYKEVQSGAVAKSYIRKGFLICEEIANISPYMRRPLVHSEFPYI